MRYLCVYSGHRPRSAHRGRIALWSCLAVFSILLSLTVPQAQAATQGHRFVPMTPAVLHATQQDLKRAIHVQHTGAPRRPASTQSSQGARPQTGSLPAYNNTGISNGPTHATSGLDGYSSYDAQTLQDAGLAPGINVTSQNITFVWPNVAVGTPDNYQASGQVIPVPPVPGAASVGLLGAATNGNTTGTATLTYTDGTTSTFTLGLTNWWTGTPQYSNQLVATFTTINTSGGTRPGTYYLYSATTSLQTSKTLQSVTLPTSASPGQLHIFAVGMSGPAYNNTGTSDDSSPTSGNFDHGGVSYSAQALQSVDIVPGQQFDQDGIAYSWPSAASGTANNYQAAGQVLPIVPIANATTLGLLGAASNTNASGTATLTFTDSSTQTFTLGFTDWAQSTVAFGNTVAATMTYRNNGAGKLTSTTYLFTSEVAIPTGKTLQSITLPSTVTGGQLHVFALGTRSAFNNLGTSNANQPGAGNYDGASNGTGITGGGKSWSIQALEAANLLPGQPFIFNGVTFTWPASYGTLADNYEAAGQSISVTPVPNATTLAFLGSGTNGTSSTPSGTATITYTDGTTSTFTLGLTDWWNGTPQDGNELVASFSTINIPGGTRAGSYYLYDAETSLQAGKTIQSVTLPSSVTGGQLHIFSIGTRSAYNNIGISDDTNEASANFDTGDRSFSAEDFSNPTGPGWNPGDTLTYEGINFIWPNVAAGQGDNYMAQGQTLPVTPVAGATSIGFVGAGSNGGTTALSSGTATLTYTDGSTSTFTLAMSDWSLDGGKATPVSSDRLFAILPHRNSLQGQQAITSYLFYTETRLQAGKTLQSVTLPATVSQGQLHIFMMGTRAGENYPNNVGTSDDSDTAFASYDGGVGSYSIEALEAAGLNGGQPFTFNGVTFAWPASYSVIPDNYQAAGQVIGVSPVAGATTLAFLGSSTNSGGVDSGTATITYTDGSTQTFTLTLTDWWNATAQSGNLIAATCSYINTTSGPKTGTYHLYYTDVALQAGKTIQSVTLPTTVSAGQSHVFAIGTK